MRPRELLEITHLGGDVEDALIQLHMWFYVFSGKLEVIMSRHTDLPSLGCVVQSFDMFV